MEVKISNGPCSAGFELLKQILTTENSDEIGSEFVEEEDLEQTESNELILVDDHYEKEF